MARAKTISRSSGETRPKEHSWGRNFSIGVLLALLSVGLTLLVFTSWAKTQLLDTDNWVAFVTPLPKDPAVANATAEFVSSKALQTDRVEARVRNALPDRIDFLAPTITEQLQARAKKAAENMVDSDRFQAVWISANQAAHQRLISRALDGPEARTQNSRFTVDLQAAREMIAQRLGPESEVLGTQTQDDGSPLQIAIDLKARAQRVADVIGTIDLLAAVLPAFVVATLLWIVVLSRDRRKGILLAGAFTSVVLLSVMIAIKVTKNSLLEQVQNDTYRSAAAVVYDSLLASLSSSVLQWFALATLIWVGALILGSGGYGVRIQRFINTKHVFESEAYERWRALRLWMADQKYYLWTVVLMIALFYLAFVINVDWRIAFNTVFVTLATLGFVQLMATPPYVIQVRRPVPRPRGNSGLR